MLSFERFHQNCQTVLAAVSINGLISWDHCDHKWCMGHRKGCVPLSTHRLVITINSQQVDRELVDFTLPIFRRIIYISDLVVYMGGSLRGRLTYLKIPRAPRNKAKPQLTLMLLVANLVNTKWCKKTEKRLKPWHMGTHLRVLSESYPMYTNMTGFRWFSKNLCILVLWTKVAWALKGLSSKKATKGWTILIAPCRAQH